MDSETPESKEPAAEPNNAITDGGIRENQWKNCVGCIVFASIVVLGLLMMLFGLARGCSGSI